LKKTLKEGPGRTPVLSAQTNYIFNQDIQNYGATFLISETSSSESGGYITNAIKQAVASSPEIKKKHSNTWQKLQTDSSKFLICVSVLNG